MSLERIWALLFATATLAGWAVWVGLGRGSWGQWYMSAVPAAVCMAALGYAIGYILAHPSGRYELSRSEERLPPLSEAPQPVMDDPSHPD